MSEKQLDAILAELIRIKVALYVIIAGMWAYGFYLYYSAKLGH